MLIVSIVCTAGSVEKVSKLIFNVIRETLHLLKQTAANLSKKIFSAKLLHTNVNCDHNVKTKFNVPYYSIKKLINMQK